MSIHFEWRNMGGLHWPVLIKAPGATPRHPLPTGVGCECDGDLERGVIRLAADLRKENGAGPSVAELVAHLRERGIKCSDRSVRECVSHLTRDHLLPLLASPEMGVRVANSPAELHAAQESLRAFAAEITQRANALAVIEQIYGERDYSPFLSKLDAYGNPEMMDIDSRRKRKRKRRNDLRTRNAATPDAPDCLEAAVSEKFSRLMAGKGGDE